MQPRWRMILRSLLGYRSRTVLVVISIAFGVTAVGMLVESRLVLGRDLEAAFLGSDPANAELSMTPFDDDFVTAVDRTPGVVAAEGRRTVTVQLEVKPDNWVDFELTVIGVFAAQKVDRVLPETGTWPPPLESVSVERSVLDLHLLGDHGVGDVLTIETPDNKERQLQVAGTAYAPSYPAGYYWGVPFGFISVDTLERLGYGREYDELLIRVAGAGDQRAGADDREYVQAIADEVADRARAAGHDVREVDVNVPLEYPAKEVLDTVFLIMVLLGALTLATSVLLVINTVSAVVGTQTRQIGVMKAIGARDHELRRLYRGLVLGYGLFAVVLAVPLAALGAVALTAYTSGILNVDTGWVLPPAPAIGVEVVVALAVPVVAAMVPVNRGVRITVREAIGSAGIAAGFGTGLVDRAVASIRFLPRTVMFALRNTFRRRMRLVVTLAALALGGAVFMAVLSVEASLNKTLDSGVEFYGYDAQAMLSGPARADQLTATASRVPDVVTAEPWLFVRGQRIEPDGSDGKIYRMIGMPAGSDIMRPDMREGRWLAPVDGNAVVATDNILKDEPDLHVGQTVELEINGRTAAWTLVGFVKAPEEQRVFYTNLAPLADAARIPGRANVVAVRTAEHDRETQDRAVAQVRDRLESQGIEVASYNTIGHIREQMNLSFDILVSFLAVMAALIGAVGGIGLWGTMSLNVAERTREIGVLRAVGASNRMVRRVFLVEGWVMGLMAWLVGVVLAVPISVAMSRRIGISFIDRPLEFAFSLSGILIWLAVVLAVSTLATLAPALAAARVTVRETLSYE